MQLPSERKSHIRALAENEIKNKLQSWSDGLKWSAIDIVRASIRCRENSPYGKIVTGILKAKYTPLIVRRMILKLTGRNSIETSKAFPSMLTQSVVFSVETLSILMLSGLQQDTQGFSAHFVPVVLTTLLSLSVALTKYEDLLHMYLLLCPVERFKLTADTKDALSRYSRLIQTRETIALSDAVSEGLSQMVKSFKDQLVLYKFQNNKIFSAMIQRKLALC